MSPTITARVPALTLAPTADSDNSTALPAADATDATVDTNATRGDAVCRKDARSNATGSHDVAEPEPQSQPTQAAPAPTASTPAAQKTPTSLAKARVDAALKNYGRAQDQLAQAKDGARGIPMLRSTLPDLEQTALKAREELNAAVGTELDSEVGADASAHAVAKASEKIAARYAMYTPETRAALSAALSEVGTARSVHAIVAIAQRQPDAVKALHTLGAAHAQAPQNVKDALMADPSAQKIVDEAAAWANQPLKQDGDDITRHGLSAEAIGRLDHVTTNLEPDWAAAVVERAAPGYATFAQGMRYSTSAFDARGMTALMTLSGRIAGTPHGDAAIDTLAATQPWGVAMDVLARDAIRDGADPSFAIAAAGRLRADGKDPAPVLEAIHFGLAVREGKSIANGGSTQPVLQVAARLRAAGLDASGPVEIATNGMRQFKEKVAGDVRRLAEHNAELSWLVENDGKGLSQQQLARAVADYRTKKGPAWAAEDAKLRKQIGEDGSRLLQQMSRSSASAPQSGPGSAVDVALREIANDPSAELAISTAFQTDPALADAPHAKQFADLFALAKVGDIGRKFLNEAASAYLRRNVLAKISGVDLHDASSVDKAKQAIESLRDENFARLLGITKSDLDKAVNALQKAADNVGSTPQHAEEALANLNRTLEADAALSKSFNKATFPGQLLRGVGVALAGASLLNSYYKATASSAGAQDQIKLIVDAAGFAQKNADMLVGLGAVSKESAIGKFGGEWKLAGRASAGDLIAGVSVVLDSVSAVRSAFGIATQQDTGNAVFSATSAVGGGLTVAPSFGASAFLGPIGLGVTAASVIGKVVYEKVKDAHRYEGASKDFLIAGGYGRAAAEALSTRVTWASESPGAAQMPFLMKYAQMKHLTLDQVQNWINGLTPQQLASVAATLRNTAMDSEGDTDGFNAGPMQTHTVHTRIDGDFNVERSNSTAGFEFYLKRDQVPLP